MTDHPNAKMVRNALEAFVGGDTETFAAALSEDVVWHAPGTNRFAGRFDGRQAMVARMRRMHEAGIRFSFDVHDVVGNDEHVVALVHAHVKNEEGVSYDGPQVMVMHMKEGSVVEFWATNQDQAVVDLILGS